MTRRERMARIIDSATWDQQKRAMNEVNRKLGHDMLTDEALDLYAATLVKGWRFTEKLNRENRARFAAQQKEAR